MHSVRSLWAFIRLARPHFLVGGVLLFALGAVSAAAVDRFGYVVGQVLVTATQLTAHFVNEHADADVDRRVVNRTLFSGGSGALAGGVIGREVALMSALFTTVLALAATGVIATVSVGAALLGGSSLAVSWAYSAPPLRLLGTGWGEAATSVVVAGLVPLVGVLSQGSSPPPALWWSIAALVPIHLAMIVAFELPDLDSDAAAGKRVLAVRIGKLAATRLIGGLVFMAAVVVVLGIVAGGMPAEAGRWAILGVGPAAILLASMRSSRYHLLTAAAVGTLVATATGLLVGALSSGSGT
jgi:1,4-dihydroxy-2-naphthoate octaprenyltransferase